MMRDFKWMAVVLAVLIVSGCNRSKPSETETGASGSAKNGGWPGELLLAAEPEGARSVGEVRKSAKEGSEVVVVGRVGGRKDPFVAGRAILMLTDTTVKACGERGCDDGCKTPWDFCCEPPENLSANTVTVQVVDVEGKPLKNELRGVAGIKPLSELVIRGRVAPGSGEKSMVVNATGIFVKQS
jgi:hypothetical protein